MLQPLAGVYFDLKNSNAKIVCILVRQNCNFLELGTLLIFSTLY